MGKRDVVKDIDVIVCNSSIPHNDDSLSDGEEVHTYYTDPNDVDTDEDGWNDGVDAFPLDPTEWNDNDNDGIGDNADADDDNDGMPDTYEYDHGRYNGGWQDMWCLPPV